jgi:hypothetical protein
VLFAWALFVLAPCTVAVCGRTEGVRADCLERLQAQTSQHILTLRYTNTPCLDCHVSGNYFASDPAVYGCLYHDGGSAYVAKALVLVACKSTGFGCVPHFWPTSELYQPVFVLVGWLVRTHSS